MTDLLVILGYGGLIGCILFLFFIDDIFDYINQWASKEPPKKRRPPLEKNYISHWNLEKKPKRRRPLSKHLTKEE